MYDILEYIQLPKIERQRHIMLREPCIERGGGSFYFKGLLAHVLDTTIPTGHKIHLCHACHNGRCGNPHHIYWGTPSENKQDATQSGASRSIWEYMIEKYGVEKSREMMRRNGNANWRGKNKLIVDLPLALLVEASDLGQT